MPNYDFKSLSPYDFEQLVRDLLQCELALTLQSFKSGRDGGVDLRYSRPHEQVIVVQCKHYAGSSVEALIAHLKKEAMKVAKLRPKRYIVATSLGLTPGNKDTVQEIFDPYCLSTDDIYGKDDINNLLGKFSTVERQHFKLWFTSTAVFERIQHSAVFNRTSTELENIKRRIAYYVQDNSYRTACEILNQSNYCIIAGIPGIGKTTLAEILLVDYISRGYEAIRISSDVSEALSVYAPEKLQVFYYDDFLGQTSLENKFNKNEESDLLRFIDTIERSKNSKFILTTREYILNQARSIYERLANSDFDKKKCVVDLANYSRFSRAKILFNHLFYNNVPQAYVSALIHNRGYIRIVDHPNYNPRTVQWMTEKLGRLNLSEAQYVSAFLDTLHNPTLIWQHAFDNQLSQSCRDLLLVLATLPDEVLVEDLEKCFRSLHFEVAKQNNSSTNPKDFKDALRHLDGNFLSTRQQARKVVVKFHNPSIRDFVELHLAQSSQELMTIMRAIIYFDQLMRLFGPVGSSRQRVAEIGRATRTCAITNEADYVKSIERALMSPFCAFRAYQVFWQAPVGSESVLMTGSDHLTRVSWILEMQTELKFAGLRDLIITLVSNHAVGLRSTQNVGNTDISLIAALAELGQDYAEVHKLMVKEAKAVLMGSLDDLSNFDLLITLSTKVPDAFGTEDMHHVAEAFEAFCPDDVENLIGSTSEPDEIRGAAETIERIAEALSLDASDHVFTLEEEAQRLEEKIQKVPDEPTYVKSQPIVSIDTEIDSLFDSLRSSYP